MKLKSMLMNIGIILPFISLTNNVDASPQEQSSEKFFSLVEIQNADIKPIPPLKYVQATDDIALAYRAYLPQQAKAILIFYHGAGAHSGLTYNHIGDGLREGFDIAVYMPDIRGHGG
ncbi:MAG: acylglycerol lipase, partial [Oleiphilaceae bacterium]